MIKQLLIKLKYRYLKKLMILKLAIVALVTGAVVYSDRIYKVVESINTIKVRSNAVIEGCDGIKQVDSDEDVLIVYDDGDYHIVSNESMTGEDMLMIKGCLFNADNVIDNTNDSNDSSYTGLIALLLFGVLSYTSTICQEVLLDTKSTVSRMLLAKRSMFELVMSDVLYGWICMVIDFLISIGICLVWMFIRYAIEKETIVIEQLEYNSSKNFLPCVIILVVGVLLYQLINVSLCSTAKKMSDISIILIVPQAIITISYIIATNVAKEWLINIGIYIPIVDILAIPIVLNYGTVNIVDILPSIYLYICYGVLALILSILLLKQNSE